MNLKKAFNITFIILFLFFIFVYSLGSNGFYEYKLNRKKFLTEEQIKKFEEDVANGKTIDINNYMEVEEKNYDNTFTDINRKISSYITKGFKKAFEYLFRYLENN